MDLLGVMTIAIVTTTVAQVETTIAAVGTLDHLTLDQLIEEASLIINIIHDIVFGESLQVWTPRRHTLCRCTIF
jgi:ABC-type spermidine/putrescine transport system permease subunit II